MGNNAFRPQIWALGLRNPWRFSFDSVTGDLYIADVGQNTWEEVNFQPTSSRGGENYGWRIMEGNHNFKVPEDFDPPSVISPVVEYDHDQGLSITGGLVYRGPDFPRMNGIYFYADFITGKIWGLKKDQASWENQELADTPYAISSFGEDKQGRLYFADYYKGKIYRIEDDIWAERLE